MSLIMQHTNCIIMPVGSSVRNHSAYYFSTIQLGNAISGNKILKAFTHVYFYLELKNIVANRVFHFFI